MTRGWAAGGDGDHHREPVADTPSVTDATTNEDTQTTNGLVISRNAADGAEVTHFKITGITNGTLALSDGTPVVDGELHHGGGRRARVEVHAGRELLRHRPLRRAGLAEQRDARPGRRGGDGDITVNAVADTPSVTNATTSEDTQTTSGLVICRNAPTARRSRTSRSPTSPTARCT